MSSTAFSINIEQVVDLLGLERDPKGQREATSFNVKCPFCDDEKYHMNINTVKNTYYCVRCTGSQKGTGALDLYGRVALDTPMVLGANGNSKKLYAKLCQALNIDKRSSCSYQIPRKPAYTEILRADDSTLDDTYSKLLSLSCFLLQENHHHALIERGLKEDSICRNQYRSFCNQLEWIKKYPQFCELYEKELMSLKEADAILKRYSSQQIIAGMIIAATLKNKGAILQGVPGFFTLGNHWCFRLDFGMVIPTRNMRKQIVSLQLRKDAGDLRYMTVSSKGLPNGVTKGISRAHFPLGNCEITDKTRVMITEGPLKSDVAVDLAKGNIAFIALHGVNNTKDLPFIFSQLKERGVSELWNAFDMDKTTNIFVAKAGVSIRKMATEYGLRLNMSCWDEDYAKIKHIELATICRENNLDVPCEKNIFTAIGKMSMILAKAGIKHSHRIQSGKEVKDYWNPETKGIDDFLLSISKKR